VPFALLITLILSLLAFPSLAQEQVEEEPVIVEESYSQEEAPIIAEESEDVVEEQPQPNIQKNYTALRFRGLNKITTKSEDVEAPIGATTRFGNLEVIPRGCWVAPADKQPEQAGLMEVWYWKQGEKPSLVFYGWMFASSPALSSLEHPVYDISMLECVEDKSEEKADEKPAPTTPAAQAPTSEEEQPTDELGAPVDTPQSEEVPPAAGEDEVEEEAPPAIPDGIEGAAETVTPPPVVDSTPAADAPAQ